MRPAAAFSDEVPAVVDVVPNPNELAILPKLDLRQAFSFSADAGCAIVGVRGKEMVGLVDINML